MLKNRWLLLGLVVVGLIGVTLIVVSLFREAGVKRKPDITQLTSSRSKPLRPLPKWPERKEIVFGASISKTGEYATEGQRVIEGYELWKDHINRRGGLRVGDRSYPVRMILYDDASKKETVNENIVRLIEKERVDFLLGPYSSGLTLAASEVAETYGVIMVETCGASEAIFAGHPRCTFAALTSASWFLKDFFDMVSQKSPRPKTYAVLAMNKLFTKSVVKGARIWAGNHGLREVYYGVAEEGTENFITYLEEMRALAPDIIVFAGHYRNSLNFTSQLVSMHELSPHAVVMTLGPTQSDYVKKLGKKAEYMTGISQWSSKSGYTGPVFGSSEKYRKLFESRYGHAPTYQNAQASAGCVIYQLAIEKCPSLDAEQTLQGIRDLDTEIFYGKIKFDSRGLNVGHLMAVIQIQNGQQRLVWPLESAESGFIYPIPRGERK